VTFKIILRHALRHGERHFCKFYEFKVLRIIG